MNEYITEDIKTKAHELFEMSFNKGFKAGMQVGFERGLKVSDNYEKGLNEAWEFTEKIAVMNCNDMEKIFNSSDFSDIIQRYTPSKAIEKIKTRGLTTFYFNDRNNKDIQEYEGKQYNTDYEFGGKIVEYNEEKSIIEIRNKLSVGDKLELLIPGKLEPLKFTINKLWDIDSDEEIDTVNPGKQGQQVKMKLPIKCEENWILRRKK